MTVKDTEIDEIVVMDPKEDGDRVLNMALESLEKGTMSFLYELKPNHGITCKEDDSSFEQAIPLTKELMVNAIRAIGNPNAPLRQNPA